MCGRYAAARDVAGLVEEFEVEQVALPGQGGGARLEPDYNVAPTKQVPAILTRAPHDTSQGSDAAEPVRQLRLLKWGLVPAWAKDPAIGGRMINARAETATAKPAYRQAVAKRRCLLPADGYYEWYAETGRLTAAGRPRKQPFYIHRRDGRPLAMAGLYEFWRDPERPADDPDAWLTTCTVLTTDAIEPLARIHDRMPLLVPRPAWGQWLDPGLVDGAAALALVGPAEAGDLEAYPVSERVNNVRNNGPELLAPLPPEEPDPEAE